MSDTKKEHPGIVGKTAKNVLELELGELVTLKILFDHPEGIMEDALIEEFEKRVTHLLTWEE